MWENCNDAQQHTGGGAGMIARAACALVAAGLALGGCATQHLAVETGAALAQRTGAAAAEARAYLDLVAARRLQANVTLVASDSSCTWGKAVFIHQPTPAEIAAGKPLPLCASDATGAFRYDLQGVSADRLKPALALIGALADYATAIDAIVGGQPRDIGAALAAMNGKVEEAATIARALGDHAARDPLPAGTISDIAPLLNLVAGALADAARAHALYAQSAADDARIAGVIAQLQQAIRGWATIAHHDNQVTVQAMERVFDGPGRSWDFATRRAFLEVLAETGADIARDDAAAVALVAALDRLKIAEADLRHIAEGHLSPAQRAERARIARAQIAAAFDAVASAAKAL